MVNGENFVDSKEILNLKNFESLEPLNPLKPLELLKPLNFLKPLELSTFNLIFAKWNIYLHQRVSLVFLYWLF